ncbi:MAG: prolipoprotein diacylglyceryl transferase [Anaerolineae bacterium]|nr:prolipoprotein diacylglyceryl transferase [Anaerolineae bacterium]
MKNAAVHFRPLTFPPVTFRAFNRTWSTYQALNALGLLLGTTIGLLLVRYRGLSVLIALAVSLAGVASIFGLAWISKLLTGEEYLLNNYHAQAVFLALSAALLWLWRQPAPAYLDLAAIGIAVMIGCGRIGCLAAGCCHGRPSRLGARYGVCYGPEHVAEGMEPYLAGVRLFPVQALGSAGGWLIAAVGVLLVLGGSPPGTVFGWHVTAYGVGRFGLEFLRGDAGRRYWKGFSEAQWTALVTIGLLVGAEALGWLPLYAWHWVVGAGLALAMIAVSVWRRRQGDLPALRQADHLHEVARGLYLLDQNSAGADAVRVFTTSLGIQLSAGEIAQDGGPPLRHYTLSRRDTPLTESSAATLGDLIARFRHPDAIPQIVRGQQDGVFHVLFPATEFPLQ